MLINKASIHKKIIRTYIRSLRHSLNFSEQYIAAQLITNKILTLSCIHQSINIAIFISFDGEIRTDLLIKILLLNNKRIYLPILPYLKSQFLSFARYTLSTPLVRNYLNIYEPKHNMDSIIPIEMLDMIFIPLVAFDKYGNRLGMGGGFYDKILQYQKHQIKCPLVGLGYDFQKIPTQILPLETWDIRLSKIITPSYLFWK